MASVQGLVDNTSMRCAISNADSRRTWARCAKSSMCLTLSANAKRKPESGSRDKGAPALAASRDQAMASARFNLGWLSNALALAAHSSANAVWVLERRSSSIFSLTALAAPLSRALSSLNTCCSKSIEGSVSSHCRTRVSLSPAVAAEIAPPVNTSKAGKSGELWEGVFTAVKSLGWTLMG